MNLSPGTQMQFPVILGGILLLRDSIGGRITIIELLNLLGGDSKKHKILHHEFC